MERHIFGPEHEIFREAVAAFVARDVEPRLADFRGRGSISRDVWLRAGEHGFLGLAVPEEHGGGGSNDFRFNAVFGEELARAAMAVASAMTVHTDIMLPYIIDLTTPEQAARWLPNLATGEFVGAIAITEPEGGSDVAHLRTRAVPDGDDFVVSGSKTFITNGGEADVYIVAVRTESHPGARGISLLVLEKGTPGFSVGRKLEKIGQGETDTTELFFDEARVPGANLLGERGRGFGYMMDRLATERLSCAISNLAHARAAFEITVEHVRGRKVFGQGLGTFQATKFALADVATALDVAQAYVDRLIELKSDAVLDPVDAAKAKLWTSEVQHDAIDACLQLFGGYGYMAEYPIARAWADARVTRIWAGTSEIMREIIGRSLDLEAR